jgi:hypothetical protein
MAYKAQSPGKLARHNEAQGSGDLPLTLLRVCDRQGKRLTRLMESKVSRLLLGARVHLRFRIE